MPSDPKSPPSRLLAGIAASLPILFLAPACLMAVPISGGERAFETMGPAWVGAIVGAAVFGAVVSSVLIYLSGVGLRVPAMLPIALAGLPWIAGLAGSNYGISMVESAVEFADPSQRATLLAAGLSQALVARIFGAGMGAPVLAAVGFGLAIGAVGQGADGRRAAGAVIGAGAALPLLLLPGLGLWAHDPLLYLLLLPALGAVLVAGLGAAAVGADGPRYRSGALATSATIAMALSVSATGVMLMAASTMNVFEALSSMSGDDRGMLLALTADELLPVHLLSQWAWLPALLPVAALAVLAVMRARPSPGRLAGAVALLLCATGILALDAFATHTASSVSSRMAASPLEAVAGYEPIAIGSDDVPSTHQALVLPGRVLPPDGQQDLSGVGLPFEGLGPAQGTALASVFQRILSHPDTLAMEQVMAIRDGVARSVDRPRLLLAVDARVTAPELRVVIDAARAAGARSLGVYGTSDGSPTPEQRASIARIPMLEVLAQARWGSVLVHLESEGTSEQAHRDPELLHAIVGASDTVHVATRPGAGDGFELGGLSTASPTDAFRREPGTIYLGFDDAATARSLFGAADHVSRRGDVPLVVTGPVPGEPGGPVPSHGGDVDAEVDVDADVIGGGRGGRRRSGSGRAPPERAPSTAPTVRGSLSSEAIRRVVRRGTGAVRRCYQRSLAQNPALEGRVSVRFEIGPEGAVSSATISESSLGDAGAESCIAAAVGRWRFPAPQGGGTVAVSYPFVFRPDP